jgi:hypothetical protein
VDDAAFASDSDAFQITILGTGGKKSGGDGGGGGGCASGATGIGPWMLLVLVAITGVALRVRRRHE